MADYIAITDAEVEPEAPLTSSLAARWRDNPIAIAEGAPGAPRLNGSQGAAITHTDALAPGVIRLSNIINDSVSADKLRTSTEERDWVLGRTAELTGDAIGTYAMLRYGDFDEVQRNANRPGSDLSPAAANAAAMSATASGTWKCLGFVESGSTGGPGKVTLWVRVA